ncbi:cardiolipin synthase [Paraburkholderia phosphatilytica]|uniref:cardiolipin synthase n=1 Tax=Paraburkholderia phosphatilytica TaxID=2282883 RepID=UPI001F0BCF51|nr:cardiolipin synthase [Paraburkholderia phosphatilytica]
MHLDWLHLGSVVVVAHILGLIAACHAVMNTRTSQGAVAWAVSLVAMPYFTLVPYLFLGRSKFAGYADARRIENELMRRRAHPPEWDRQSSSGLPTDALGQQLVRSLTQLGGMPFLAGNTVRTLVNGEATFAAILDAIEHARRYIIVQFFIVRADPLGEMLKDALIAKAARGVRVYFLYDSIGSFDLPHRYIAALRAGGVETHPFATNRRFVNRFQLNFRNHRKIVSVDGERAFVGGHNVGVEYLGARPPLSPWRDTHIEVHGPAVASIQFVFTEDWHWATQQLPAFPMQGAEDADGAESAEAAETDDGSAARGPAAKSAQATAAQAIRAHEATTSAASARIEADLAHERAAMQETVTASPTQQQTQRQTQTIAVTMANAGIVLPPSPAAITTGAAAIMHQTLATAAATPAATPTAPNGGDERSATGSAKGPQTDMHCLVVPTGPADRFETCSLFFVESINAARERVWITTPYLVPDEAVLGALRLAVLRGVDVRILIPSRRDHYVVFEASKLYAFDAVRSGIRIFRYRPGFLHQKVVLIDDVAAAIGSANLDNRSFRLNFEVMVLTVDRGFAAEVEAMLLRDFADAYEIDRTEYRRAPAWRRVTMHLARLFSPIL